MPSNSPLLVTCLGVEHDLPLLPHFLQHYLDLGVSAGSIVPILNTRDPDSPRLAEGAAILEQHGVRRAEIWIADYTSDGMWAKRRELQRRVAAPDDWVVSADVDELHEYPESLAEFLMRCERLDVDVVQGVFIDRLAESGELAPVAPRPSLQEQFPVHADVIRHLGRAGHSLNRLGSVKLMAMKGHHLPSRGGHHLQDGASGRHLYSLPLGAFPSIDRPDVRFRIPTRVHHFHWTEGLVARLRKRLQTPGASQAGSAYGRRQIEHLEAHGGIALKEVWSGTPAPSDGWERRLARLRREGRFRSALLPVTDRLWRVRERLGL